MRTLLFIIPEMRQDVEAVAVENLYVFDSDEWSNPFLPPISPPIYPQLTQYNAHLFMPCFRSFPLQSLHLKLEKKGNIMGE